MPKNSKQLSQILYKILIFKSKIDQNKGEFFFHEIFCNFFSKIFTSIIITISSQKCLSTLKQINLTIASNKKFFRLFLLNSVKNFFLFELRNFLGEKDDFYCNISKPTEQQQQRLILLIQEMKSNFQEYNWNPNFIKAKHWY